MKKKKVLSTFVIMLMLFSVTTIISASTQKEKNEENKILNNIDFKIFDKIKTDEICSPNDYQSFQLDIEIIKPENGLYLFGNKIIPFSKPIIFGPITIEVDVTGGEAAKVEFYIDDSLKMVDYEEPFEWRWDETSFTTHTIEVKAYPQISETFGNTREEIDAFFINFQSSGPEELSKDDAIELLINQVIKPNTLDHVLYAFTLDEPLGKGDKTSPWLPDPLPASIEKFPYLEYRETLETEWFFWIDDVPRTYFVHNNRFVYINAVNHKIEVNNEQWWPVLNDIDLWSTPEELWNSDYWAYTNDDSPPPSFSKNEFKYNDYVLYREEISPSFNDCEEGAIVCNGGGSSWFGDNEIGMDIFWGTYPGFTTETLSPPDNTQSDLEDAFDEVDCDDTVVYICGHGGTDASGEPYVNCGGDKVTEDELCDMAEEHPDTEYKWIIQSCHSGNFMESLKELDNSAKIITSCRGDECSWSDWDPAWDTNPDDKGSEFTSGLIEDLWDEWYKNPSIDIVQLLDNAFVSAVEKDACADERAGEFRETPQLWERPETDETPPNNNIVDPEDGEDVSNPVTVTGLATDVGSGIAELDYKLEWDGGSYEGGSLFIDPPENFVQYLLGPIELLYYILPGDWITITIYAIDAADNVGSDSITVTWVEEPEDDTPPVTEKTVGEPNDDGGYMIWAETPIMLDATDDMSGVQYIHYEIWWDNDGDYIVDELVADETIFDDSAVFMAGQYGIFYNLIELRWFAVDNADNVEEMHSQEHYVVA